MKKNNKKEYVVDVPCEVVPGQYLTLRITKDSKGMTKSKWIKK